MCGTFFDQAESWCTPCDSANIDSLKLGGMHTLNSLRSKGVYVGHTTGQPSVGNFEGTLSYVFRLISKRPSGHAKAQLHQRALKTFGKCPKVDEITSRMASEVE